MGTVKHFKAGESAIINDGYDGAMKLFFKLRKFLRVVPLRNTDYGWEPAPPVEGKVDIYDTMRLDADNPMNRPFRTIWDFHDGGRCAMAWLPGPRYDGYDHPTFYQFLDFYGIRADRDAPSVSAPPKYAVITEG